MLNFRALRGPQRCTPLCRRCWPASGGAGPLPTRQQILKQAPHHRECQVPHMVVRALEFWLLVLHRARAYLEQGTSNIAKDVTVLRNRVAALGIHNTLRAKRAQLYRVCTDDADLNILLPPSTQRAIIVHLFGGSTTILSWKSAPTAPSGT